MQVKQENMRHLCNDTLVTLVNGQFPGPAVEATEGDTVIVHLINESPYGMTIHWYVSLQHIAISGMAGPSQNNTEIHL
jgi:laccase